MDSTPTGLAASWGALSARIAAIVASDAALLRRLVMAPRAAHHATAFWLYANPSVGEADARAFLEATPPKFLLTEIAGDGTRVLFKALGKLEHMRVYDARFYLRLRDLATSELAPELVHVAEIDEARIDSLETLLAVGASEPLMRALAPRLVNAGKSRIRALADGLVLLRRLGLLGAEKESAMRRAKNVAGLFRLIARTLDRATLPGLGLELPTEAHLRAIDTLGKLRAQGLRFRNCLRWSVELLEAAVLGRKAFFSYQTPGSDPILVALDVVVPGVEGGTAVVSIDQIKGVGNVAVDGATTKAIKAAIEVLPGVRVVGHGFDRLLRLALAAANGELSPNDDDPDLADDFMEAMLLDFQA